MYKHTLEFSTKEYKPLYFCQIYEYDQESLCLKWKKQNNKLQ